MSFNILISGMGSIGQRHCKNVQELGERELAVCDPFNKNCPAGAQHFNDYEDALRMFKPNVVLVCSPTNLHIPQALRAVQMGCHVFIEKPLSYSMDGVKEMEEEAHKRHLTTMVACNMRFHSGPVCIKRLIDEKCIGDVLSVRISTGSYLPRWKRETSHTEAYSADTKQGGAALDCIHEIDLALWYAGPAEVIGTASRDAASIGLPGIDGLHEVILRHASGTLSSIHMNFIQQDKRRTQMIIGTTGTLYWEYRGFKDQKLEYYGSDGNLQETHLHNETFDPNRMYLDELTHFFTCVEQKKPTGSTIKEARNALEIALHLKRRSISSPDPIRAYGRR